MVHYVRGGGLARHNAKVDALKRVQVFALKRATARIMRDCPIDYEADAICVILDAMVTYTGVGHPRSSAAMESDARRARRYVVSDIARLDPRPLELAGIFLANRMGLSISQSIALLGLPPFMKLRTFYRLYHYWRSTSGKRIPWWTGEPGNERQQFMTQLRLELTQEALRTGRLREDLWASVLTGMKEANLEEHTRENPTAFNYVSIAIAEHNAKTNKKRLVFSTDSKRRLVLHSHSFRDALSAKRMKPATLEMTKDERDAAWRAATAPFQAKSLSAPISDAEGETWGDVIPGASPHPDDAACAAATNKLLKLIKLETISSRERTALALLRELEIDGETSCREQARQLRSIGFNISDVGLGKMRRRIVQKAMEAGIA